MKKILVSVLVLFITFPALATRVATFPDLMDPKHLLLDGEKLYISDYPSIYIINRSDYSLQKKFGKTGRGPGEFYIDQESMNSRMRGLMISLQAENGMLVKNETRLSFFSRSRIISRPSAILPLPMIEYMFSPIGEAAQTTK